VPIDAEITRRGLRLKRSGSEMVGPCPVCGGVDRFGVNLRKGVFNCRGSGTGGDVIALVEYLDATDFLGACETLAGRPAPKGASRGPDAEEIKRREAARQTAEAERERGEIDYREQERARMWRFWQAARPIVAGSPVARYLEQRSLAVPAGAALRQLAHHPYFEAKREIWRGPAMIAAIVGPDGVFRGGHVTWIDPETAGKAEIVDPDTGEILPAKKVRGSKSGNHIALSKTAEPTRLVVGEGIETVLSARLALSARKPEPWLAATLFWSSVDLGNLGGPASETIPHPSEVRIDSRGAKRRVKVPGPVPAVTAGKPVLMPPASLPKSSCSAMATATASPPK
jgi:hypothetical protein